MFLFVDAIQMIRDIRSQSRGIGIWGGLLNIPQLVGGVIFIWTIEGAAILAVEVFALAVAGQIHKRTPFSRLIGLCHLPWLALLPWLVHRLMTVDHSPLFAGWLLYVAATIFISLVFDVQDIYRYGRGDRRFSWAKPDPGRPNPA